MNAAVIAANTLAEIRTKVLADCSRRSPCDQPPNSNRCWQGVTEKPGNLYVAVVLLYECNRPVKDNVAVSNSTVYYVHWLGSPQGVCTAAMAIPAYRLFLVPRTELPSSGALTVELQMQTQNAGIQTLDTQVELS
jgi:hypothetical protein